MNWFESHRDIVILLICVMGACALYALGVKELAGLLLIMSFLYFQYQM